MIEIDCDPRSVSCLLSSYITSISIPENMAGIITFKLSDVAEGPSNSVKWGILESKTICIVSMICDQSFSFCTYWANTLLQASGKLDSAEVTEVLGSD